MLFPNEHPNVQVASSTSLFAGLSWAAWLFRRKSNDYCNPNPRARLKPGGQQNERKKKGSMAIQFVLKLFQIRVARVNIMWY
jgi:hypothetical protein